MSVYQKLVTKIGLMLPPKFQAVWFHPAGPTTVFFWAPAFKWGLVIAGIDDMNRHPQNISVTQTASLTASGAIWSRYSMVIVPKNWVLFSVNIFVCAINFYNFTRGISYEMEKDVASKK